MTFAFGNLKVSLRRDEKFWMNLEVFLGVVPGVELLEDRWIRQPSISVA